jgi:NAD(P)-dependent dehydrogenase (short-subunit alcohol dehydrogenase family)
MTGQLQDQVALITGGNSGIGRATARLFVQEGARVVIAARDGEKAQATLAELRDAARFVACDVRQPDACQNAVDFTLAEFGQVDILFNNAGIVPFGTVAETSLETWRDVFATNVDSVFYMCRAALPHLLARGQGVIINNASDVAVVGAQRTAAYSATKGAIAQFTKSMALDHARQGLRINAVCPGETYVPRWDTRSQDMAGYLKGVGDGLPLGRVASPDEIAQAVLFLASNASSFMTGQLLVVDGGHTAGGTSASY